MSKVKQINNTLGLQTVRLDQHICTAASRACADSERRMSLDIRSSGSLPERSYHARLDEGIAR